MRLKGGYRVGKIDARNMVAVALATCAFGGQASASAQLPSGGQVVAGQATITSTSATSLLIQQGSAKAIIDWSRFSIGRGASVAIDQPGASSILLNRVTGNAPSWLLGTLTANGQVWLVNPAGIYVGAHAHLTAAGLLLSTADIANNDFLAGNYNFGIASSDPNAWIVNKGSLVATGGGSVVAAAPVVRNDGLVEADLGTVVLAGAKTYTVDFAGDNLLSFAVTGAVEQVAPGTTALVSNDGTVAASGGRVLLTADAAKGVLDNVINTSGIVEATSVASVNGKVVLSGSGGGTLVSGTLDVSGKGTGETGGTVKVLGDTVTLASTARLDASGDAGGGTVLVGGNFAGAGPERHATATTMAQGASIAADAITSGTGGKVALWSDGVTDFSGSITARGGATGGNGGYVETSGHDLLFAAGRVNTSAPRGKPGTWLLDPFDLTIDAGGASAIESGLTSGNVEVDTPATGSSSFGTVTTGNGDITVASPITWANGNTLTLNADNDVNVNANITNTAGGGSLVLEAGAAITQSSGSLISLSSGGSLTMTAVTGIGSVGAPIRYGGGLISASVSSSGGTGIFVTSPGDLTLQGTGIIAQGGDVSVAGSSITVQVGDSISSSSGSVSLTGAVVLDTAAEVTASGSITISGSLSMDSNAQVVASIGSVMINGATTMGSSAFVSAGSNVVINGPLSMDDAAQVSAQNGTVSIAGPVSLIGSSAFVSAGSNVSFGSTIDGGANLTVSSSSGSVSFGSNIGVQTPLAFLDVQSPAIIGGSGVTMVAGTLEFDSTIDGPGGLSLNASGAITVAGDIGLSSPLASFAANADGSVEIAGSIVTRGNQSYNSPSICFCGSEPAVTLATSGGMFSATGSSLTFSSGGLFTIDTTVPTVSRVMSSVFFSSTDGSDTNFSVVPSVSIVGDRSTSGTGVTVLTGPSLIPPPIDIIGVSTPDPPIPPGLCAVASSTCNPDQFFFPPGTLFPPPPGGFFVSLTAPEILVVGDGSDTPPLLLSITDIDPGDRIFFGIVPFRFGEFQDPLTFIPPVTPATQAQPKPPSSDQPLGDYIYQSQSYLLRPPGVPGLGQPSLGNGNRSLWFANPEGTQ